MICLQVMAEPLLRKATQGFSVARWKNYHHCHHAATDLHSTSAKIQDGDPDINTMSSLA